MMGRNARFKVGFFKVFRVARLCGEMAWLWPAVKEEVAKLRTDAGPSTALGDFLWLVEDAITIIRGRE
jgi:hypothetical protein